MPVRGSRTRGGANTPRPESRAVFPRDVRAQWHGRRRGARRV